MMHSYCYNGEWSITEFIWSLFIIALTALFAIWLVRSLQGSRYARPDGSTPLGIAKQRYAKGEITKAEYDQLRQDLQH